MKRFKVRRQPFLLLEVLIAFVLVSLCALPLIYPHVVILRTERAFVSSVELDHLVNLLYAKQLEKLYKKETLLSDILGEKTFSIDESLLADVGYDKQLPYVGSYRFEEVKHKPPKSVESPSKITVYLFKLIFSFKQKEGQFLVKKEIPVEYCYKVMIESKHE